MTAVRWAALLSAGFAAGWVTCLVMGLVGSKRITYSDLRPGVRGDGGVS